MILLGRHFTLFPSRRKDLAADGYDAEWTPPEPFNRRMWAGAKLDFQSLSC
jgi:hydroxyacyl-ACP dehydratase HTD2-like protein with hotdog domain